MMSAWHYWGNGSIPDENNGLILRQAFALRPFAFRSVLPKSWQDQ